MICYPLCKINIGLNILNKRSDGYHNIESIMVPVPLRDILEIIPANNEQNQCTTSGFPIPGNNANNLVIKALELMQGLYEIPGVHIHLHKRIPMGAGLGGGSSDAAFTLMTLNNLFGLNLKFEALEKLAAQIGSDCAFFIKAQSALASGRGEILDTLDNKTDGLYIQIIKPDIHISTAEAYAGVLPLERKQTLKEHWNSKYENWQENFTNDFEHAVFKKYLELKTIKETFYKEGAIYSSMSGSGSAIYGLFQNTPPPLPGSYPFEWEGRLK